MDNGKIITVDISAAELEKRFKNETGSVRNGYVRLGNALVNPSHVSIIEIVADE